MSEKTVHRCDRCGIWTTEVAHYHGKILCSACLADDMKGAGGTRSDSRNPEDASSSKPSEQD